MRILQLPRFQVSFLLVAAFLFVVGCEKTGQNTLTLQGTYSGTFERQGVQAGQKSNVTLTFDGENWQGQSDTQNYPALCNGRFLVTVNQVQFSDLCTWSPDIDGSFILTGDYALTAVGDSVILSKQSATYKDVYSLKKQ